MQVDMAIDRYCSRYRYRQTNAEIDTYVDIDINIDTNKGRYKHRVDFERCKHRQMKKDRHIGTEGDGEKEVDMFVIT